MPESPGTAAVPPPARTVCELFEQQFRERPDAVAIRTPGRSWTYAEFDAATGRLARWLRRRGADHRSIVGLLAPRGPEALIGIVAVIRSGAACLPLDVADPPRRNQEVLADAGCTHVLSTAPLDWLPEAKIIGADGEAPDPVLDAEPLPVPHPLDLAYAITTSGSTGRPKIVGVPHQGLINLVLASLAELDLIRPDDVMLWTLSPTVDSSMHDVLMPLCCGAAVAIAEHGDLPASRIVGAVRAMAVTVLEVPAAVLGPYGHSLLPRLARAGVRLVITGGSQLDGPGLADAQPLVVHNGYGPTEASVAATWHLVDAATPNRSPIGAAIRDVRVYLLDDDLRPVADGEEGQIFIAGAGLARGYLGLPARTAAVFLPDPFAPGRGERMYATGDRARRLPDGNHVYLGRMDDQIKIRGFRVEIGEVEHCIRECSGVVDVAVQLREDAPGGTAIAAYLVGTREPDGVLAELLRDRLPGHMIPRYYRWLDELPINRAGKVDYRALATVPLVDPVRQTDPA